MDNSVGYLRRIAINTFGKRYRRAGIFRSLLPFLVTAESSTPADARLTLSEALRALTPRQPRGPP